MKTCTWLTVLLLTLMLLTVGCADRKDVAVTEEAQVYSLVGSVSTPGFGNDLVISDTLALVADNEIGITVISIKDPTNPYVVSSNQANRRPIGVDAYNPKIQGEALQHLIFTAEESEDVPIYNFDRPDSVFQISSAYSQWAQDVFVDALEFDPSFIDTSAIVLEDGRSMFLFVADRERDFLGYWMRPQRDILNNIFWFANEMSEISMPGTGRGVTYENGYIYIATGEGGLNILDATDLYNIILVGHVDTNGSSLDVKVSGNYAYVADDQKGLQVIDITDKNSPVIVANVDTRSGLDKLTVHENRVFAATSTAGLYIFDVTDPTNPVIIQRYDTPNARAVEVVGPYVYLIDQYDGLLILQEK